MTLEERVLALESKVAKMEQLLEGLQSVSKDEERPASANSRLPSQTSSKVSPVSVQLISKKFHKANLLAGDAGDRIDFALLFKSEFGKDVRALKGAIVFKDLFDDVIMKITLAHESGLPAGGSTKWEGGFIYNQFLSPHQRLLSVEQNDIQTCFEIETVVFKDGTRETFA